MEHSKIYKKYLSSFFLNYQLLNSILFAKISEFFKQKEMEVAFEDVVLILNYFFCMIFSKNNFKEFQLKNNFLPFEKELLELIELELQNHVHLMNFYEINFNNLITLNNVNKKMNIFYSILSKSYKKNI